MRNSTADCTLSQFSQVFYYNTESLNVPFSLEAWRQLQNCHNNSCETNCLFFFLCEDRGKQPESVFMSQEDLECVLRERVSDCPDEILCELSEHLVR